MSLSLILEHFPFCILQIICSSYGPKDTETNPDSCRSSTRRQKYPISLTTDIIVYRDQPDWQKHHTSKISN